MPDPATEPRAKRRGSSTAGPNSRGCGSAPGSTPSATSKATGWPSSRRSALSTPPASTCCKPGDVVFQPSGRTRRTPPRPVRAARADPAHRRRALTPGPHPVNDRHHHRQPRHRRGDRPRGGPRPGLAPLPHGLQQPRSYVQRPEELTVLDLRRAMFGDEPRARLVGSGSLSATRSSRCLMSRCLPTSTGASSRSRSPKCSSPPVGPVRVTHGEVSPPGPSGRNLRLTWTNTNTASGPPTGEVDRYLKQ